MNTEENFKNNIRWLLQELKKDEMSTLRSEYISFEYSTLKDSPSIEDQRRIIRFLVGIKTLKISRDIFPAPFNQAITGSIGANVYGIKPSGHLLELLQPTFDKTYELFETTTIDKNKDSITSQALVSSKTSEQKLVCVLNTIKQEFELGTHSGWIDIPASDFFPCGVDRDKLSRIINKFTNEKIINQFVFIDSNETKDEEEYDYDVYRLFLSTDFSKKADSFIHSIFDHNTKDNSEHSEENNETLKNKDVVTIKSLSFNKNTGDFVFNKVKGNFTPKSQEFHFLKTILESKDNQSDYTTLVSKIWNGKPNSKSARNDLNIIVRNVKQKLLILPKTKSKNPDILKSVKNVGYRIIVPK